MTSLADITRETRLIAKFGGIGISVIVFLFLSYKAIVFVNSIINPPVVEPPEMRFGILEIVLPLQTDKPTYAYQLNTITGSLPVYPDRIRVYRVKQPEQDLLALQKTREIVSRQPYAYTLSERNTALNTYAWNNPNGGTITYNILTHNFIFSSGIGLENRGYLFEDGGSQEQKDKILASSVISRIKSFGGETDDLDADNATVKYFRSDGKNLIPEPNTRNAYLAQVDLFQNPIAVNPFTLVTDEERTVESLPIYYQDSEKSNQSFLVKAGYREIQFIQGTFNHYAADTADHSTYPIKTTEEAYKELENGNAYIISTNNSSLVEITEAELAYFIPQNPVPDSQGYMYVLPVYVFKGKDFIAYVNAIGNQQLPTPSAEE